MSYLDEDLKSDNDFLDEDLENEDDLDGPLEEEPLIPEEEDSFADDEIL